ncbi:MAG: ABC transporter permease [Saprospiraceae bacterium]|nr:ABC transporter permease [Saprospiraceae bacterium]
MRQDPPRLAQRLFSWYCKNQLHDSILGDLDEQFYQYQAKYGTRRARWNYWLEVFRFINRFTLKREELPYSHHPYTSGMLKNNLISSLRFFKKNLGFTLINVVGLTLGLSSFLLILSFVQHERSFDHFHSNKEHVYRVNFAYQDNAGNTTTLVNSPPALAPGIRGKFPEVAKISRLRYAMNNLFSQGDNHYYESRGFYADSLFLEVLPFDMLAGDRNSALDKPNSVVITQALALKYFNEIDPLGKTLRFNNTTPLEVTGVLADLPSNSHLDFDFLISFPNYIVPAGYASDLTSWSWLGFLTYVELKPNTDPQQFENGLTQHFQDLNPEQENHLLPQVQHLQDIYLGSSSMSDDLASPIRSGNQFTVKALLLVAILILIIAGFNFSNLSQALSLNRKKTIGMRKILGAERRGIILQLLTESLLLSFFCLVLSGGIVGLVFPYIAQYMHWEFELGWLAVSSLLPLLLGVGVVLGILSGLNPAWRLANTEAIASLKGTTSKWNKNPFQLKQLLLTLQFAMSIGLICTTFIMTKQIQHLRNTETGYQAEHVVLIKMLPADLTRFFELYKEQLVQHAPVMQVSRSERVVGEPWPFSVIRKEEEDPEKSQRIFFNQVDFDYFETLDLAFSNGRSFSKAFLNDPTQAIIINEIAADYLKLENPIGQRVHFFNQDGPRTIVGVVKDFNYTSLHHEMGPAAIVLPFIDLEYMYVRFKAGNPQTQIALLEETWEQVAGDIPLQWKYLDDDLARLYESEQKLSGMIQVFSLLAILLACLGLYGMVAFMISKRIKEVGVRKVLGASLSALYLLFVKAYFLQCILAMIIVIPMVQYLLSGWLENFAYHVAISWWVYPMATLLLIFMILLTVTQQIIKAAKVNPTLLLRNE